jgi:hypothetical protein
MMGLLRRRMPGTMEGRVARSLATRLVPRMPVAAPEQAIGSMSACKMAIFDYSTISVEFLDSRRWTAYGSG